MASQHERNMKGKIINGEFNTQRNPFVGRGDKGKAPELSACADIGRACDRVLAMGCAIMLGHTRDGGALVITILDGNDRHRTYCADERELDMACAALYDVYAPQ